MPLPLPVARETSEEVFEKFNPLRVSHQVAMAAAGPPAVASCAPGLPALLPVSGGRAPVPVDQRPGPRVRGLQFSCQGAFFPRRVF